MKCRWNREVKCPKIPSITSPSDSGVVDLASSFLRQGNLECTLHIQKMPWQLKITNIRLNGSCWGKNCKLEKIYPHTLGLVLTHTMGFFPVLCNFCITARFSPWKTEGLSVLPWEGALVEKSGYLVYIHQALKRWRDTNLLLAFIQACILLNKSYGPLTKSHQDTDSKSLISQLRTDIQPCMRCRYKQIFIMYPAVLFYNCQTI